MKESAIRFSVSLPPELLEMFDAQVLAKRYASRSEYTRDLIRRELVESSWGEAEMSGDLSEKNSQKFVAVFVIVYDHHQSELMSKKMQIEHDAKVGIVCTNHIHIDHHNCLETIVLNGESPAQIEAFCNEIAALKGVKFSNISRVGVPKC